jgi:putative transcriptional regulator
MVKFNIEELLARNKRSKYWLCQQMSITSRNINRLIRGETTAISFKYIEDFCRLLNCRVEELIIVTIDENKSADE